MPKNILANQPSLNLLSFLCHTNTFVNPACHFHPLQLPFELDKQKELSPMKTSVSNMHQEPPACEVFTVPEQTKEIQSIYQYKWPLHLDSDPPQPETDIHQPAVFSQVSTNCVGYISIYYNTILEN